MKYAINFVPVPDPPPEPEQPAETWWAYSKELGRYTRVRPPINPPPATPISATQRTQRTQRAQWAQMAQRTVTPPPAPPVKPDPIFPPPLAIRGLEFVAWGDAFDLSGTLTTGLGDYLSMVEQMAFRRDEEKRQRHREAKESWERQIYKANAWKRYCQSKEDEIDYDRPARTNLLSKMLRKLAGFNPNDGFSGYREPMHLPHDHYLRGGAKVGFQVCNEENWDRTVRASEDA